MKFCSACGSLLNAELIDGHERLVCAAACGYIHWNNPIPVVAALVKCAEQYIVARNVSWPPGDFSLIAGFLEAYEAPEQAIMRETKEELGLISHRVQFIGHYTFPKRNQIILAYLVEASGDVSLNHELAEYKSLNWDELNQFDFGSIRLPPLVIQDLKKLMSYPTLFQ